VLEQADDLVRIEAPVDPHLEIATIIDRVDHGAGRGRALLFTEVKGSELTLVANLFGTLQRVTWALGTVDLKGLAERFAEDLAATGKTNAWDALQTLLSAPQWQSLEIADDPAWRLDASGRGFDLLPALHAWPGDGGRYLTLAQVFTRHPETGQINCGMYRVQLLDHTTALLRCHPGSGGGRHLAAWRETGQAMPVAIVLGGPPALTWAAGVPLPDGVEETALVGYLTRSPVHMARLAETGLCVPATAEIVIEGSVSIDEERLEGPFGNHTGNYMPAAPAPVLHLTSIALREQAVYPCTLVGPPPREDLFLARATERLLLPLLRFDLPWVEDIHMPLEGIFHRAALVAVNATASGSLTDLSQALRQSPLLRGSRLLVLLDADVDLRQSAEVYWRTINCPDWSQHLSIDDGCLVIDARRAPDSSTVRPDPAVLGKVLDRWHEFGLD
jgi:4-hydroxy-3-polyprenylbenzoate decarboxylase